jgi:hypothetical protein
MKHSYSRNQENRTEYRGDGRVISVSNSHKNWKANEASKAEVRERREQRLQRLRRERYADELPDNDTLYGTGPDY